MTLIAESAGLQAFCARLAKADYITVDTEFLRDSTYWPKLCLLQVAGPEEDAVAAIDTLAEGLDLSPLLDLFDDRGIVKVLHSARQDMEIFFHMTGRLEKSGRAPWLDEEMAILTSPETYRLEPEEAWRRLKTRSNDRRYLAVLRALATWRELEAQQRDVPRGRVLRDEQLFDIAAHRPTSEEELARSRGINRDLARGRIGKAILEAVAQGLAIPEADLPKPPPKPQSGNGIGPLMDLLKVMLKLRCEEHDVAQKLIASSADLEQIAISDEADVLALRGWRYEIFGRDALALKHGTVALSAAGSKVRVVPLERPGKG